MVRYLETRKDLGTFSLSNQSHPSLLYVRELTIKEGLGCVVPFSRDSIGGKSSRFQKDHFKKLSIYESIVSDRNFCY